MSLGAVVAAIKRGFAAVVKYPKLAALGAAAVWVLALLGKLRWAESKRKAAETAAEKARVDATLAESSGKEAVQKAKISEAAAREAAAIKQLIKNDRALKDAEDALKAISQEYPKP